MMNAESSWNFPYCVSQKTVKPTANRDGLSKTKHAEELDSLVDTEKFIKQTSIEMEDAQKEEISRLQNHTLDLKAGLERELDELRIQLQQTEKALENPATRIEKIRSQKELSALRKELKTREQNLFFDGRVWNRNWKNR